MPTHVWRHVQKQIRSIPSNQTGGYDLLILPGAKEQGSTILLVSRDHQILDIADRVVSLEEGRLLVCLAKGRIPR